MKQKPHVWIALKTLKLINVRYKNESKRSDSLLTSRLVR
jgi:hypothetical protein